MRIVSTVGATQLNHDSVTYESDGDGVFEVPEEAGQALVRFPHWLREHEAVDYANAARAADAVNPSSLATRVRELEALIASLQRPSDSQADLMARVAELEAENATLKAPPADEVQTDEPEQPAPAAAKATAKKTAAKSTDS